MVETEAMATPADLPDVLPAMAIISGTIHEMPIPININPIVAEIRKGKAMAIVKPTKAKLLQICNTFLVPSLLISLSPKNLAIAAAHINAT